MPMTPILSTTVQANNQTPAETALRGGLRPLAAWMVDSTSPGPSDNPLVHGRAFPLASMSIIATPATITPIAGAEEGWDYWLGLMRTHDGVELVGSVTDNVVEIAEAARTTDDPEVLLRTATSFWSHLAVHNFLQGVRGRTDVRGVAREQADGQADHLGKLIGLEAYGFRPRVEEIDVHDPTVAGLLDGSAMPIFAERARRRGAADDESAARASRRCARQLSNHLIGAALPASRVSVVTDGEVSQVEVGQWIHSYELPLEVVPTIAALDYSKHLADGAQANEAAMLNLALNAVQGARTRFAAAALA